jgi:hypothetical protein
LVSAQITALTFKDRGVDIWTLAKDVTGNLSFTSVFTGNIVMFLDQSAPASSFVMNSSGDIGLGTNTPASKLHVVGSARIEGSELRVDNNADNDTTITIDSGSAAPQHSHFVLADRGFDQWLLCKPPDNTMFIQHVPDGGPSVTFRPNRILDLDLNTRFEQNNADPLELHNHSSRHDVGGADELDWNASLGSVLPALLSPAENGFPNTVQLGGNSIVNVAETPFVASTWTTLHQINLNFSGRTSSSKVFVIAQGNYVAKGGGGDTVTIEQRMRLDSGSGFNVFGLNSFNSTRRGTSGNEEYSCWNFFWLSVPAANVTIEVQAFELNANASWTDAMIIYTDIGESLAIS